MAKALGENKILYIQDASTDNDFLPIACLTSNVFSESAQFLSTTTRDNAGWDTSRPVSQGYGVSFSATSDYSETGKFVVNEIQDFKRAKTLVVWAIIDFEAERIDYGRGYISSLSESADVGGYVTFDGEIEGYGEPYNEIPTLTLTSLSDPPSDIGSGNYSTLMTWTSSDAPINLYKWMYGISATAYVEGYADSVLKISSQPLDNDMAIVLQAGNGQEIQVGVQLQTGWNGPLSNILTIDVP